MVVLWRVLHPTGEEDLYCLTEEGILTNETVGSFVRGGTTPERAESIFTYYLRAKILERLEVSL